MRSFLIALIIVIPISFLFGMKWTKDILKRIEPKYAKSTDQNRPTLAISAYRGWIPDTVLEALETKTGFHVRLEEYDKPLEVWQKLEKATAEGTIELITLTSAQIEVAKQLGRLQNLPSTQDCTQYHSHVAADFKNLPDRPGAAQSLAMTWAVTGWMINQDTVKNPGDSIIELIKRMSRSKTLVQIMRLPEEIVWLSNLMTPPVGPVEEGETDESEKKALENFKKSLQGILKASQLIGSEALRGPFTRWNPTLDLSDKAIVQAHHTAQALPPFKGVDAWKFLMPKEKAMFWIGYLAPKLGIVDDSRLRDICLSMQIVAEQLSIEPNGARFVENTGLSLTFTRLESSSLADEFKPSYLRKLPLTRMEMRKNFAGDAMVESILDGKPME